MFGLSSIMGGGGSIAPSAGGGGPSSATSKSANTLNISSGSFTGSSGIKNSTLQTGIIALAVSAVVIGALFLKK